jgi:uncharacterized protein DUF6398
VSLQPAANAAALRVPGALFLPFQAICSLTDRFCADHLDAEYAALCRKLVARLARKRPSPLVRGDLTIWAAAAIHTVGAINFLFDPAQRPHLTAIEISDLTGVAKSSIAAKSKLIRDVLRLKPHDPELCRRELLRNHPSAWLVELDGLVVDARWLPRELLEEASRRGLVPDLSLLDEEEA